MDKIIKKRVGYFVQITLLMALLFINIPEIDAQAQSNCTDSTNPIKFRYVVPLRNVTTSGDYVNITGAQCNVTIFKKQLNVDNVLNNSQMFHLRDGLYSCNIYSDWPTDKYATYYTCNEGNTTSQNYGRFEVVPDDVPLSIIIYLIGVSILFLFFVFTLPEDHNAIRTLLFLSTFLIYFVIFVLIWNIVVEEGATTSLINISRIVFIAYSILFTFIVIYVLIQIILSIISLFHKKKFESDFL
jgi:hypothetical protein